MYMGGTLPPPLLHLMCFSLSSSGFWKNLKAFSGSKRLSEALVVMQMSPPPVKPCLVHIEVSGGERSPA